MDDLISRQAAIDAIADYLSKTTYTSAISYLNTAALILARVPSAQPEQITCEGCRHIRSYDTDFPCSGCIRREKDYYEREE